MGGVVGNVSLSNEQKLLTDFMAAFLSIAGKVFPAGPVAVWSDVRPAVPLPLCPVLDKEVGVPETALWEALPCVVTPLSFHLSLTINEKFIDLCSHSLGFSPVSHYQRENH